MSSVDFAIWVIYFKSDDLIGKN